MTPTKGRMLTGDRPTGSLHLGHYVGSLQNRVRLHREYETFIIIADLHMLTTKNTREDIRESTSNAREVVLDCLGVGMEPELTTFYLQSAISQIGDLNTLFQNLTTVSRLSRIPSLKDMARDANKTEMPYGLLGYPVLQAADILCVRATAVPVGADNAAHVEVTREIARRFNHLYGETFPIPDLILSETPNLVGTDGSAKMSKSLGNAIYLKDDAATVRKKVFRMYTDPARVHANVPGTVENNPVFVYHEVFNDDKARVEELKMLYRAGNIGDVEVKEELVDALNRVLEPIRARRERFAEEPGYVEHLLTTGTERTRAEVATVVADARKAMGLSSTWNRIRRKAAEREKRGVKTAVTVEK
jgi:tryptophanyl-tRNA synthetase